jgi:hypothetical protein
VAGDFARLNLKEHMWDGNGRLERNYNQINNVNDLRHALLVEWQNVPSDVIRRLTKLYEEKNTNLH